jgi:Domain of unknown function DUF11
VGAARPGSAINNVIVTDPLPASLTFISVTSSEGSCTGTATVRCDLGTLDAGRTATITLVARVTADGSITNTVTVPVRQPENDDKDEERREARREREERERQRHEEEETQGTVVAVACAADERRSLEAVVEDDGKDLPYVVIITLDGNQKVRLRRDALRACSSIRLHAYLEAIGEKQHEHLFDADGVKIRDGRP